MSGQHSYEELLQKDLKLIWTILHYIHHPPKKYARLIKWVQQNILDKVISKHPWRDITAVIWIFFAVGMVELRFPHFWVVTMNLGLCCAMRLILAAKRPVEYDIRLQPFTDVNAESYGFPSLESYMSVVIMGHLSMHFQSVFMIPASILICFLVGFSRIYSRARFPHQIVGSWILGAMGLVAGVTAHDRIGFRNFKDLFHNAFAVMALLAIFINFALSMENNDSRLVYVPREVFVQVLGEIINGGSKDTITDAQLQYSQDPSAPRGNGLFVGRDGDLIGDADDDDDGNYRGRTDNDRRTNRGIVADSPRTQAIRGLQFDTSDNLPRSRTGKRQQMHKRAGLKSTVNYVKSDSLYFLQRQMERREDGVREAQKKGHLSSFPGRMNNSAGQSSSKFRPSPRPMYDESDTDDTDDSLFVGNAT